jgi:hypothetical protein
MITKSSILSSDVCPSDIRLAFIFKDLHRRPVGVTSRWITGDHAGPASISLDGTVIGHASGGSVVARHLDQVPFGAETLISQFELLPEITISEDFAVESGLFPVLDMAEAFGRSASLTDGQAVGKILHHYDRFQFSIFGKDITAFPVLRLERSEEDLSESPSSTRNGAMVCSDNHQLIGIIVGSQKPFYYICPLIIVLKATGLTFLSHADIAEFNAEVPSYLTKMQRKLVKKSGEMVPQSAAFWGRRPERAPAGRSPSQFDELVKEDV